MWSEARSAIVMLRSIALKAMMSIFRCSIFLRHRHHSPFTTVHSVRLEHSALSMATASKLPIHWCYGRHNLVILPMLPRSLSINLLPLGVQNGCRILRLSYCYLMATKDRDQSIQVLAWNATCSRPRKITGVWQTVRRQLSIIICCAYKLI